jgi:hypothetical protein
MRRTLSRTAGQRVLEAASIEFIPENGDVSGLRLRK